MTSAKYSWTELSYPVVVLGFRFEQRWDIYARQLDDGRYVCVHKPLNTGHLFAHLKGEITLGTYLLDENSNTRHIVLDTDDRDGFSRLKSLANNLSKENIPSYLEKSRRGGHLWMFFRKEVSGIDARSFGKGLQKHYDFENVELFPKQDLLSNGPGSLIRMPFGKHRVAGQRYGFFRSDGKPLAPTISEQIKAFAAPEMVPEDLFHQFQCDEPEQKPESHPESIQELRGNVIDRIKGSITVLDFIGQYVDLKPVASGAIGLCPFHDDHNPSLGINSKDNYWKCFAGCGGGSIIDFWMKWQGCDFATAINELPNLLLYEPNSK